MSQREILKLLPAFEEKFLSFPITQFGRQWTRVNRQKEIVRDASGKPYTVFFDERKNLKLFKRKHLEEHFSAIPTYGEAWDRGLKKRVPCVWGSYGLSLRFNQGIVKFLCWDADNEYYMDLLHQKLIPWLDEHETSHILEYSGYAQDRAHLWVPTTGVNVRLTNQLFDQIRRDCEVEVKEWFDEQYPYAGRETSLIRIPFGLHTKHMDVFLGEYKGAPFRDTVEGLEAFIEAPLLTEEKILSFITVPEKERKEYKAPEKLLIHDAFELTPSITLPEVPGKLSSKCLAIHRLIDQVVHENKLLNKRGGFAHNTGLALCKVFELQDHRNGGEEGKESFRDLIETYRDRTAESHNWDYYWGEQGAPVPWNCDTMDKTFDNCEGCPYRDRIRNPIQLLDAEEIKKEKIGEVQLRSLDEIRAEVFPEAEKLIYKCITEERTMDLLIESPPESGKSHWADVLAARLSKEGKKVAIACNSINVALEHKKRVESNGARAFVMASWESIFEKEELSRGIICPHDQAIRDCRSVGVDSHYYKKKYCKECPFFNECAFPQQYTQVQEDRYQIVIIQHAHFACEETIRQLFKKHFDVLIVDENFNDFLINQLKPTSKELEILKEFGDRFDWVAPLLLWLNEGGKPQTKIDPSRSHLTPIHKRFTEEKEPYRLPDFLRCYRNGDYYDLTVGLMKFIPVPECHIRIILDATASLDELEIILNNPHIKSVGGGLLVDPKYYHPENETYQILDGKASKAEMLTRERLYEYLEYIGDLMMDRYSDLTALITVFKEAEQDTWDWLIRNYPSIVPRIAVNHMAIGTNEWAKYNVQFILASVYQSPKMYKVEAYKIKFIKSYWLRLEGEPPIRNPYPGDLPDDIGDKKISTYSPVERDHMDGRYSYSQFSYKHPKEEHWEYLVFQRLLSKFEQAIRIRFQEKGKKTIVYVFNNQPMKGRVITQNLVQDEILAQYQE